MDIEVNIHAACGLTPSANEKGLLWVHLFVFGPEGGAEQYFFLQTPKNVCLLHGSRLPLLFDCCCFMVVVW